MAYYISENNKDEKVANSTEESILKGVTFENLGKKNFFFGPFLLLRILVLFFIFSFHVT